MITISWELHCFLGQKRSRARQITFPGKSPEAQRWGRHATCGNIPKHNLRLLMFWLRLCCSLVSHNQNIHCYNIVHYWRVWGKPSLAHIFIHFIYLMFCVACISMIIFESRPTSNTCIGIIIQNCDQYVRLNYTYCLGKSTIVMSYSSLEAICLLFFTVNSITFEKKKCINSNLKLNCGSAF